MIDPKLLEVTESEWVEWSEEGFFNGFAYVLKEGAPEKIKRDFEKLKAAHDAVHNTAVGDEEQAPCDVRFDSVIE